MNWILDIILVAFIVFIIIRYTKKGCQTIFSLLTPLVTFVCAYLFGKPLGKLIMGDKMLGHTAELVESLLRSIIPEEGISYGSLRENAIFRNLIGTTVGEGAGDVSYFDNSVIIGEDNIAELAEKLAGPVASMLAQIIGCIVVFILVRIGMFIVSKLFAKVAELPILKQFDSILGFIIGVISAFAYTWIICLALSFIVRYNLIGSEADILHTLAKDSIIVNFFNNLSLVDIVNLVK